MIRFLWSRKRYVEGKKVIYIVGTMIQPKYMKVMVVDVLQDVSKTVEARTDLLSSCAHEKKSEERSDETVSCPTPTWQD